MKPYSYSATPEQRHASFSATIEDKVCCIVDHNDGGKTVTNDAEEVIFHLASRGIDFSDLRVIYRDTDGIWDELLISNNAFDRFRSLHEIDKDRAKARVSK